MIGATLSHYRIDAELGRGGMGIVYKAEDTKLDRMVAIKVLPSAALASDDDRARFYREAKAAAQLNHPNIAAIYEIDEAVPSDAPHGTQPSPFIAMEYIEGQTLDVRTKDGPQPLKESVRIAIEVAEALKAAHAKNIVHRDIKSSNIMLDGEGRAKVLDFGLAKTAHSTMLTRMGSTLGTVAYMSPEQARGSEVDARTDLWSLGVVLYEMLSGRPPFGGDYEQAVVYTILNEQPNPLTSIRTGFPMGLEWIITKLLAKNADERYQSAADLIVDLKTVDLSSAGMSRTVSGVSQSMHSGMGSMQASMVAPPAVTALPTTVTFAQSVKKLWPLLAFLGVLIVGLGIFALLASMAPPAAAPLKKLPLLISGVDEIQFPRISADGRMLSYVGRDSTGQTDMYLFDMEVGLSRIVSGTRNAGVMNFSPSGSHLAFSDGDGGISVVVIPSGVPVQLAAEGNNPIWVDGETLYFVSLNDGGIKSASLAGGAVRSISKVDTSVVRKRQYWPTGPIANSTLIVGSSELSGGIDPEMFVLDTKTGDIETIEQGIINVLPVPGGYLAYQIGGNDGSTVVRPFDPDTRSFTGIPNDLIASASWDSWSVGSEGSFLYTPMVGSAGGATKLYLYNIESGEQSAINPVISSNELPARPAYSPDGSQIAFHIEGIADIGSSGIYVYDRNTGVISQRTFGDGRRDPDWSADGSRLLYHSTGSDGNNIYSLPADGSGQERLEVEGGFDANPSVDGRWLAFSSATRGATYDIWVRDVEQGIEIPIDTTLNTQVHPHISPDNKYVAYVSGTSTGTGEGTIVIRRIDGSGQWTLPVRSGSRPKWSPDGKYLYYAVQADAVFRIPVTTDPVFRIIGAAEHVVDLGRGAWSWIDISPDGKELAIASPLRTSIAGSEASASIILWQNWAASLKAGAK